MIPNVGRTQSDSTLITNRSNKCNRCSVTDCTSLVLTHPFPHTTYFITVTWLCLCYYRHCQHKVHDIQRVVLFCSSTAPNYRYSGTLRTVTTSCARATRYHTNAIALSDFTIATWKWEKLYKLWVRRSVTCSENVILLPCKRGACCGPACTLPLEVSQRESSTKSFQVLTDIMRLYIIFTCVTITCMWFSRTY